MNFATEAGKQTPSFRQLDGGDGYESWRFRMEIVFDEHDVLEIVRGDAVHYTASTWKKRNTKAKSLLVSNVSNRLLYLLKDCETANAMWLKLETQFRRKTFRTQLHYSCKWRTVQYKRNVGLTAYFSELEGALDQFRASGGVVSDTEVIHHLFDTLSGDFELIIQILENTSTDALTLQHVLSTLLDSELKVQVRDKSNLPNVAFIGKNKIKCYGCGQMGHKRNSCPEKNKTSTADKTSVSTSDKKTDGIVCYTCGQPGHKTPQCTKKSSKSLFTRGVF